MMCQVKGCMQISKHREILTSIIGTIKLEVTVCDNHLKDTRYSITKAKGDINGITLDYLAMMDSVLDRCKEKIFNFKVIDQEKDDGT